jgi:hypothetical protein
MNGHLSTPPRRLERFLERILVHGDWQSVTGDLREEYAEVILPSVFGMCVKWRAWLIGNFSHKQALKEYCASCPRLLLLAAFGWR